MSPLEVPPVPVKATGLIPSPAGPHYQLADYMRPIGLEPVIDYFAGSTPCRYQAGQPECAGFATAKILEWHNHGEYPTFLSPQWAYREGKERDGYAGPGTNFWAIFQGMRHEGICLEEEWPFEDRWPPAAQPAPTAAETALKFRIATYAQAEIDQIHQALAQFGPLVIGIRVYTNFYDTPVSGIAPAPWGALEGGHGMDLRYSDLTDAIYPGGVVGGWNSWSTRWGKDGRWYIPYSYLATMHMETWSVVDVKHIPLRWLDLGGEEWTDDDKLSIDKVWQRGAMKGYPEPDGTFTFRPNDRMRKRHVGIVMRNVGLADLNPWENDWSDAERGWVKEHFPQLTWNQADWQKPYLRRHALLQIGRWLRGV